jgi:hypothetical protein
MPLFLRSAVRSSPHAQQERIANTHCFPNILSDAFLKCNEWRAHKMRTSRTRPREKFQEAKNEARVSATPDFQGVPETLKFDRENFFC